MAFEGIFSPSLDVPIVSVTSTEDRTEFKVSWPSQPGSSGYRVYAGFDPLHIRSLISGVDIIPSETTEFTFLSPVFPPGQIIYFWVSTREVASDRFLDEFGSFTLRTIQSSRFEPGVISPEVETWGTGCFEDNRYFFEEIRRRAVSILEDTSEEVDVFIKQWRGLPDPSTQDAVQLDPNFQGMTRDDNSFGTGFFPGYFPAIRIRMRFGSLPTALLDFQGAGLRPLLNNEAWTSWAPILHENDLVVRVSTGQRYAVDSVAHSNWRGVAITQRMSLQIVTPTSPLQKVTDAIIRDRWTRVNSVDFLRAGFGIAGNELGGPDFLIFG